MKSKLMKGAKKIPFQVDENSTSSNLIFSTGSWHNVVLPSIKYWKEIKSDQECRIGEYVVRVGGTKSGKDSKGWIVDSQIVFFGNRDKIVCHLYNTTQHIGFQNCKAIECQV